MAATEACSSCRNGLASVLGDASGKSAEQITDEFASNSITGRFTRPDEVMGAGVTIDGGMVPTL